MEEHTTRMVASGHARGRSLFPKERGTPQELHPLLFFGLADRRKLPFLVDNSTVDFPGLLLQGGGGGVEKTPQYKAPTKLRKRKGVSIAALRRRRKAS